MLPNIRKILYATDLSRNAQYAFGFAVSIALKHSAKISIINVIEKMTNNAYLQLTKQNYAEAKNKILKTIKQRLERYGEQEQFDVCIYSLLIESIIIKSGSPVESILNQAKSGDYDLIVMGTHGHGMLIDVIIGSNAKKMVQQSNIPVLVVRIPD